MIRTALSFCLLFGGLFFVSKWLHQSADSIPAKTSTDLAPRQTTEPAAHESAPQVTTHYQTTAERNAIQLVAFEDTLDEVLESLRPSQPASGRIIDTDSASDSDSA